MVACHWTETAVEFGIPLSDCAAVFRIALLISLHEEGTRKGCPKIVYFTSLVGITLSGLNTKVKMTMMIPLTFST